MSPSGKKAAVDWRGVLLALAVTAVATGIGFLMVPHVTLTNVVMVYILGAALVASTGRLAASVMTSILGVAAFDFFFVPPSWTFEVEDLEYVFTFAVMLAVSLVISTLTIRLRTQSEKSTRVALDAQVEKMRADLLSGVSHDLRTPLASIEGSADALLSQPELTSVSRQLAATIQDESVRMSKHVRNLLDMTRVQGLVDLDLDWYGLDELVANAIMRTEGMFKKPIQLAVREGTALVYVDGVLMEQVFVNLLENAARHAGTEAAVSIEIAAEGEIVRTLIMDDGPGIQPGSEDKVFQRFYGSPEGFGLGLAICRSAVEAHKGTISIANRPGGGACITLDLPGEGGQPSRA